MTIMPKLKILSHLFIIHTEYLQRLKPLIHPILNLRVIYRIFSNEFIRFFLGFNDILSTTLNLMLSKLTASIIQYFRLILSDMVGEMKCFHLIIT